MLTWVVIIPFIVVSVMLMLLVEYSVSPGSAIS